MVLRIEFLRIVAVPPKPLAVGFGELAIVRHAGQRTSFVRTLRHLIPGPGARAVNAHGEAQPEFARGPGPRAYEIALRPEVDGVPRLVPRIEVIEVVMVIGQGHEILRAVGFVERQ